MGNSLGHKKTSTIMKVDGETFKVNNPMTVEEVLKDFPGHVLLDSESVKHYGARAKPLEGKQRLESKRLYFVVESAMMVKEYCPPRRVRSGIQMSAKERLESLMLARRSSSDLSILKPIGEEEGAVRVKLRIPKAELEKLVKEGATEAEATQKIVALFMAKQRNQEEKVRVGDKPAVAATSSTGTRAVQSQSRLRKVSFMEERGRGSEISVA